jgi:hypothetical protein
MIDNPVVLGLIVMILVWFFKLMGWTKDGWQSNIAVLLVSLVVAVIEGLIAGKFTGLDPVGVYRAVADVMLASQLIYQPIRRGLDAYQAYKVSRAAA